MVRWMVDRRRPFVKMKNCEILWMEFLRRLPAISAYPQRDTEGFSPFLYTKI
jgi:hypothetical protein